MGSKLFNSHRRQAKSVPGTERAVPGRNLAGKRVREEDMTTEDEDEDVIEHKRPDPKKTR